MTAGSLQKQFTFSKLAQLYNLQEMKAFANTSSQEEHQRLKMTQEIIFTFKNLLLPAF